MKRFILAMAVLFTTSTTWAGDEALNQTLVRIINQINAITPLLDEAKGEIAPNARITLHIDAFEGTDGQRHAGLRDDLMSIRNALIEYINQPAIAPKTIQPLELDFTGK